MNEPRHPIEASLRNHTENREFAAPPLDSIITSGSRLSRRRAMLTATGSVAAVALVAGLSWAAVPMLQGDGSDAPPAGTPKSEHEVSPTTDQSKPEPKETADQWPPAGVTLTPCAEIPRIAEPGAIDDFTVDVENGILTFSFPTDQGERTVDIAYLRDEQCRNHPDVRELIKRVEGAIGSDG